MRGAMEVPLTGDTRLAVDSPLNIAFDEAHRSSQDVNGLFQKARDSSGVASLPCCDHDASPKRNGLAQASPDRRKKFLNRSPIIRKRGYREAKAHFEVGVPFVSPNGC